MYKVLCATENFYPRSLDVHLGPIHTGRTRANSNANPLMLHACSVDTLIHINRSHLLALRVCVLCG